MYFKNSHNIFLKAVSDINNNIRGKDSAGSHGCVCVWVRCLAGSWQSGKVITTNRPLGTGMVLWLCALSVTRISDCQGLPKQCSCLYTQTLLTLTTHTSEPQNPA